MSSRRPGRLGLALAAVIISIISVAPQAHARMGGGAFGGGSMPGVGGQTTTLAPGRTRGYGPTVAPPPAAGGYYGHHRPHIYIPGQYGNSTTGNSVSGLPK